MDRPGIVRRSSAQRLAGPGEYGSYSPRHDVEEGRGPTEGAREKERERDREREAREREREREAAPLPRREREREREREVRSPSPMEE